MHTNHGRWASAPLATMLALLVGLTLAPGAEAAVISVNATADDYDLGPNGNCTLREAIIASNQNLPVDGCPAGDGPPVVDQIDVPPGFYALTIQEAPGLLDGEWGDLDVLGDVVISGAGATLTIIDAIAVALPSELERVLSVLGDVAVEVVGVTLQGGRSEAGGGLGFRGLTTATGTLRVSDSIIRDNAAPVGGGIVAVYGQVDIWRSTIEGNLAAYGGGVAAVQGAVLNVYNSTISDNEASGGEGSAVSNGYPYFGTPGQINLRHVTITGNSPADAAAIADYGSFTGSMSIANTLVEGTCLSFMPISAGPSLGGNLESPGDTCHLLHLSDQVNVSDPMIGPLQDNGGETQTHALLAGSPAIDTGFDPKCFRDDQTGYGRPVGPTCDIGAYEYRSLGGCQVVRSTGGSQRLDLAAALIPCAALVMLGRGRSRRRGRAVAAARRDGRG